MAKRTDEDTRNNQEIHENAASKDEKQETSEQEESLKGVEDKVSTASEDGPAAEGPENADRADTEEQAANNQPDTEVLARKVAEQASEIEKLKQSQNDLNNRWLRVQADFDNFRKRTVKEKADARKFRAQDLVTDMLEILDNFKRALEVETASEDGTALKKGMEMVLAKLEAALKKEGVEEIESLGKPFDPNIHQAVMQEKSEEHDPGIVIQVLQAGYKLNGRVIRPAMVKVSA